MAVVYSATLEFSPERAEVVIASPDFRDLNGLQSRFARSMEYDKNSDATGADAKITSDAATSNWNS
jgi:hypothetical protein